MGFSKTLLRYESCCCLPSACSATRNLQGAVCRRRILTILLPKHMLGEFLQYTPYLVLQFLRPSIEFARVLTKHYGFTDEELDFIIDYDIKYRMGL